MAKYYGELGRSKAALALNSFRCAVPNQIGKSTRRNGRQPPFTPVRKLPLRAHLKGEPPIISGDPFPHSSPLLPLSRSLVLFNGCHFYFNRRPLSFLCLRCISSSGTVVNEIVPEFRVSICPSPFIFPVLVINDRQDTTPLRPWSRQSRSGPSRFLLMNYDCTEHIAVLCVSETQHLATMPLVPVHPVSSAALRAFRNLHLHPHLGLHSWKFDQSRPSPSHPSSP